MTSRDFRDVLHARPFHPFSFTTVDGETFTVDAPEDAWHPPDGEIVAVSVPTGVALVDIESITRLAMTSYPPGLTGQSGRLRDLKRAEPFVPFVLHLAGGRQLPVESADHIMIPRSSSTVVVAGPYGLAVLDSDQIREIALRANPSALEGRAGRLRGLMHAEPFVPFVLHLADGRRIPVTRAEGLAISPGGSIMLFVGEDPVMLDADRITDVEPGPATASNRTRAPGP
jgi:hypothetical protein